MAQFTDPTTFQLSRTLGQKLISVVDKIRDIPTRLGLRPYKVRIVRIRWSGARRGQGTPVVEAALDILPTPRIMDLTGLTEILHPVGLDEEGSIMVSEISGRFTDDDLRFHGVAGAPQDVNVETFYEIEYPQPGDRESIRRRFQLVSAPYYAAEKVQWTVRLEKAHEDRARNGDPRG